MYIQILYTCICTLHSTHVFNTNTLHIYYTQTHIIHTYHTYTHITCIHAPLDIHIVYTDAIYITQYTHTIYTHYTVYTHYAIHTYYT